MSKSQPFYLSRLVGMFDKQNRGSVSFNDFAALWKYVTDWQACFRSFDQDNSGTINKNELLTALKTFGYNLSDATVQTIMTKFDRNRNNSILFDDFIQCCVLLNVSILLYGRNFQRRR